QIRVDGARGAARSVRRIAEAPQAPARGPCRALHRWALSERDRIGVRDRARHRRSDGYPGGSGASGPNGGTVMDDEMQLWTVRAFDDASALVPLPPRERWIPKDVRPERTTPALMAVAIAILLAFGLALWFGFSDRLVPASSAKPIPPGGMVLVPGSSESSTWGGVYEHSLGATVLRPTWLPFEVEKTNSSVVTGGRFI